MYNLEDPLELERGSYYHMKTNSRYSGDFGNNNEAHDNNGTIVWFLPLSRRKIATFDGKFKSNKPYGPGYYRQERVKGDGGRPIGR